MLKNCCHILAKTLLLVFGLGAVLPAHLRAQSGTVFRTFQASELTVKSPILPVARGSMWEFHIVNNTGATASGLYVHFYTPSVHLTQHSPFTVFRDRPWINGVEYTFFSGGTVPPGGETVIAGNSHAPLAAILSAYWMNDQGLIIGAPLGVITPTTEASYIPMPNTANVRVTMYQRAATAGKAPITVGVPQPHGQPGAWVTLKTNNQFILSMIDGSVTHQGPPHGFDYTNRGVTLRGAHLTLSPNVSNNELFAQLVAFKMNLSVSSSSISPNGLGGLTYYEPGHLCSGMTLDQIAGFADSMMTYCWNFTPTDYQNIDYVIHKVNFAFDGPIDTVSFVAGLKLKGVPGAAIGTYLFSPGMPLPVTHGAPEFGSNVGTANVQTQFSLKANYPNPFNPTTNISFTLNEPSVVTLNVYNVLGQEVATLLNRQSFSVGQSQVTFDASSLPSGTYFDRITAVGAKGARTQVGRMVLIK